MALNWNTIGALPRLYSYADADRHERETKPIRGDKNGTKPLGRRNQKYRSIKRLPDDSIAIYEGGYWRGPDYHAPLLRYYPNGELHILAECYNNKATSNEVITRVTGMTTYTEQYRAWVKYDGGTVPLARRPQPVWCSETNKWLPSTEEPNPTIFVLNERGNWVCKNPPKLATHVVNRQGAKAVRARYANAIDYVATLRKLKDEHTVTDQQMVEGFPEVCDEAVQRNPDFDPRKYAWHIYNHLPPVTVHQFDYTHAAKLATLLGSDDPADNYRAYLWLSYRAYADTDLRKRAERVLMMHHHDEWLTLREHEAGTKVIDRYGWAVPK